MVRPVSLWWWYAAIFPLMALGFVIVISAQSEMSVIAFFLVVIVWAVSFVFVAVGRRPTFGRERTK